MRSHACRGSKVASAAWRSLMRDEDDRAMGCARHTLPFHGAEPLHNASLGCGYSNPWHVVILRVFAAAAGVAQPGGVG
jgi:hypothetical protein